MPEYDFSKPLGNAVKVARGKSGLAQIEVADRAGMDVRTVLNIENCRGNPKMQVIYPLVRTLKIDPRDIFYPELKRDSSAIRQIQLILAECSEQEIQELIPVVEAVLSVRRSKNATVIKWF